ncbi:hypothetical protein BJX65DRAFT_183413 [Aspergillus insuetus]
MCASSPWYSGSCRIVKTYTHLSPPTEPWSTRAPGDRTASEYLLCPTFQNLFPPPRILLLCRLFDSYYYALCLTRRNLICASETRGRLPDQDPSFSYCLIVVCPCVPPPLPLQLVAYPCLL